MRRRFALLLALTLMMACAPASPTEERVQGQVAAERTRLAREQPAIANTAEPAPTTSPTLAPTHEPATQVSTPPARTPAPTVAAEVLSEQDAVARVLPSIVRVSTADGMGSGIVLDSSGHLLTNAHVVGTARRVEVQFQDGPPVTADVVRTDVQVDLAVLQVASGPHLAAVLADVDLLHPGDPLFAIGYALDLPGRPTVTRGIFSAHRTLSGVDYVQTDTPINPGNSGGALISLKGQVVGVDTFRLTNEGGRELQGLNFAISTTSVRQFLNAGPGAVAGSVATAPTVTPRPTAPQTGMISAEDTVRAYYAFVTARDFRSAYRLMATDITDTTDATAFAGWFSNKHSLTLQTTRVERAGLSDGIIVATLTSEDSIDDAEQIADYVDRWTVVPRVASGGWLLWLRPWQMGSPPLRLATFARRSSPTTILRKKHTLPGTRILCAHGPLRISSVN
jgi:S1-C subfamily serine protease